MDEIIIKRLLLENTNEIKEVADIMYSWWGKDSGFTLNNMEELVKSCANNNFPITLIAMYNDSVIGAVSLVANDTQLRQDLFPVLTSLYVKEEYRNQQVASKLIKELIKLAKHNFKSIYLMTSMEGFYEKFGFEFIEVSKAYINIPTNKILSDRLYKITF